MEITKIYPLDAVYDKPEDVPEDVMKYVVSIVYVKVGDCFYNNNLFLSFLQVKSNKRYAGSSKWTVQV